MLPWKGQNASEFGLHSKKPFETKHPPRHQICSGHKAVPTGEPEIDFTETGTVLFVFHPFTGGGRPAAHEPWETAMPTCYKDTN